MRDMGPTPKSVDDFTVDQEFRERRRVTDEAVRAFAALSGDRNQIHLDDAYAKSTRFGGRIAHGALLIAFLSKVLGMDFPGPGAVYFSQTIEFLSPVYVGDEIEILVRIDDIDRDARVLTVSNEINNLTHQTLAARGVSRIKLPRK